MRAVVIAGILLLSGCNLVKQAADPALVAKINYVCVYSGLFQFATTAAASIVPVPGAAMAASLVNSGAAAVCADPEKYAAEEATVVRLIADFKAAGKM